MFVGRSLRSRLKDVTEAKSTLAQRCIEPSIAYEYSLLDELDTGACNYRIATLAHALRTFNCLDSYVYRALEFKPT